MPANGGRAVDSFTLFCGLFTFGRGVPACCPPPPHTHKEIHFPRNERFRQRSGSRHSQCQKRPGVDTLFVPSVSGLPPERCTCFRKQGRVNSPPRLRGSGLRGISPCALRGYRRRWRVRAEATSGEALEGEAGLFRPSSGYFSLHRRLGLLE